MLSDIKHLSILYFHTLTKHWSSWFLPFMINLQECVWIQNPLQPQAEHLPALGTTRIRVFWALNSRQIFSGLNPTQNLQDKSIWKTAHNFETPLLIFGGMRQNPRKNPTKKWQKQQSQKHERLSRDVGPSGPNNKHSLKEQLWQLASKTVAPLRVARLGWIPR